MPSFRHWWVRVDLESTFDHARDFELLENLTGYAAALDTFIQDDHASISLLLSFPSRTRGQALTDAGLLLDASCSARVVGLAITTLRSWRASHQDAVTSLTMPGQLGPAPELTTREARIDHREAQLLRAHIERPGP